MRSKKKTRFVLAGDVGGTKTHVGLFQMGKTRPIVEVLETFPSQEFPSLEDILVRFSKIHPQPVRSACLGIAGPVVNGRSKTTNLPWIVSAKRIQERFGWGPVHLINDLAATAYAVPLLRSNERVSLNRGRVHKGGTVALLAPGTGLGKALLVSQGDRYIAVPSEGGHVDFAPQDEKQIDLWRHLRRRFGHVSTERVVSGPGLVSLYQWLIRSGRYREPRWLKSAMRKEDPAKVITDTAFTRNQPLCAAALDLFIDILGAVAGNLALTAMATGGLYLGGGIPPKVLPRLKTSRFMKSFTDKGRFRPLLQQVPVRVILNDRAALLGAAQCAWDAS
jgi:glucokinase